MTTMLTHKSVNKNICVILHEYIPTIVLYITSQLQERMVVTDHMTYEYKSSVTEVIISVLFIYKIILHLVSMTLALCTHDIKVKGLEDAKCIIAAVYFTTINLILVGTLTFIIRDNLYAYTTTIPLLTFFSTTVILGLIFIPKARVN